MAAAQVQLYDGGLLRFAEVGTASDVRRTYKLDNHGIARFVIDRADPQAKYLDPRRGNVVVITSESYPVPWAGKAVTMRGDPTDGTIQVSCKSYDAILDERFLGDDADFDGSASRAFADALGQAGANPHGIGRGLIADTEQRFKGVLSRYSARQALDGIAETAGMEWWLEHKVSGGQLSVRANMASARGVSRYATTALVHGGPNGPAIGSWTIDGEVAAFSATVVGGASSPIQGFNDRVAAAVIEAPSDIGRIHGFQVERDGTGETLMTSREVLSVAEALRERGRVVDAARVALARPGAQRRLSDVIVPLASGLWPQIGVGEVVRCVSPLSFLEGFDGPMRVNSIEVREEAGEMALSGGILGPE